MKLLIVTNKFLILNLLILILILIEFNGKKQYKKKIGVVGLRHEVNIGNQLLKYAMFIKLSELGFKPFIIGTHWKNKNISFLKEKTNLIIIKKNFSEIKRYDYDFLIVNSDQTWRKFDQFFYDYGFLKFAENWNITKIVYGASLGFDYWTLTKKDEIIIKKLLRNFKGISVREEGSRKLIRNHLGIQTSFVLDPTLLIDKKYYLNLIKNYNGFINGSQKYFFNYSIRKEKNLIKFMKLAEKKLNYKFYNLYLHNNNCNIEDFIYGIVNSKGVITNSYHGTLFSIILVSSVVVSIFLLFLYSQIFFAIFLENFSSPYSYIILANSSSL